MSAVKNARRSPTRWYGLHFVPGVAEYAGENGENFRIFVNEDTIRKMNPTFEGLPVYVRHVDEVNLDNLQSEADGYVVKSFYNEFDGKTWAEFLIVSDKGYDAIVNKRWRLSNAYIPTEFSQGGVWNGVSYKKEVKNAKFEHMAIVPNPRYDESKVLTPEEFKNYNEGKEQELKRVSNSDDSKGNQEMKFSFFKKEKIENAKIDLETMVTLPESKKEMSLQNALEVADKFENMHGYANGDHMVKVNDSEEMTVNELVKKYSELCAANSADKGEDGEAEVENEDLSDEEAKKKAEELKEHEEKEIEEKKKNELEKKKKNIEKLENAHMAAFKNSKPEVIEILSDKVKRGKELF